MKAHTLNNDGISIRTTLSLFTADELVELIDGAILSGEVSIHPYGFMIFKLNDIGNFSLRMHVWLKTLPTIQHPIWMAHTHSGDLHSLVLMGSITNKTWKIETVNYSNRQIFNVGYRNGLSTLTATKIFVTATAIRTEQIKAGAYYTVKDGVFHSIHPKIGSETVTIVLMERREGVIPEVVGHLKPTFCKFDRKSFSQAHITQARNISIAAVKASLT